MVKITNGVDIFEVTTGAYEGIYRHQGYQAIEDDDKQDSFVSDGSEDKKTADEIFIGEIVKKPISQWSKEEVKHYASIKGIDLTGTRSVNEARDIIRKAMSEEE